MERWRGKIAVVTGAASGIGEGITFAFLKHGINVVGFDLQDERLRKAFEEWKRQLKGNHSPIGDLHVLHCDISKEKDLKDSFQWVRNHLGGIDIMVNNAGVANFTKVVESDRKVFERLLNINVLAVAVCIREAVSSMRERSVEGHVFNVNSVMGHMIPETFLPDVDPNLGLNMYPACKHATVALTTSVRRELVELNLPIRITSICPGMVKTNITKSFEVLKNYLENSPALLPQDIADGVIYALGTRPEVQVTELTIRLTGERF